MACGCRAPLGPLPVQARARPRGRNGGAPPAIIHANAGHRRSTGLAQAMHPIRLRNPKEEVTTMRALLVSCALLGIPLVCACDRNKSEPLSTTETTSAEYRTSFLEPQPALTRYAETAIAMDRMLSLQAKNV